MNYRTPASPTSMPPAVARAIERCESRIVQAQSGFAWTRSRRRAAMANALREAARTMRALAGAEHQRHYLDRWVDCERERFEKGDHRGGPLAIALAARAEFHTEYGRSESAAEDWNEALAVGRAAGGPRTIRDGLASVWLRACVAARRLGLLERWRALAEELASRPQAARPVIIAAALGEIADAREAEGDAEGALHAAIRRAEFVAARLAPSEWRAHAEAAQKVLERARRHGLLWSCDRYVKTWAAAANRAKGDAARKSLADALAWEVEVHRDAGDSIRSRSAARAEVALRRELLALRGGIEPDAARELGAALMRLSAEERAFGALRKAAALDEEARILARMVEESTRSVQR